jgi:hypothetical protein
MHYYDCLGPDPLISKETAKWEDTNSTASPGEFLRFFEKAKNYSDTPTFREGQSEKTSHSGVSGLTIFRGCLTCEHK